MTKPKIECERDFCQRMQAIEAGMDDYAKDVIAYAEFMDDWRKREAARKAAEQAA